MDAKQKHDQHFVCKILKILCRTCVFCCKKYPTPICILLLFYVSYLFFPRFFTFLIVAFPLAGLTFHARRVFLGNARQNTKRVEEDDDRRNKFAKSRRSFKSMYGDRSQLIRRNATKNSDGYDKDDIFSKSLNDLLFENNKPKEMQEVNVEEIAGKGECSSLNGNIDKDEMEGENFDISEDEDNNEPLDTAVRWTENDQKNVMDLGLSEAERNTRLVSLMERRRSRKNLGYEEGVPTVQISAVKTTKLNPFLQHISRGAKSPGSAPCSWLTRRNPFDLPYDPHEEKLDLSGDNFQEEFNIGHQKEPVFCRHESFSLGGLTHPETAHEISERKTKETSDADETEFQRNVNSYEERKADIVFFYGGNKRIGHAPTHSMVSDLQVEISDEGSGRALDDLDLEREKESWLNSSNVSDGDLEVVKDDGEKDNNPSTISGQETVDKQPVSESSHIQESSGSSRSSVAHYAPDGLTEVAVGQTPVTSTSPKSVLQREYSTDPASPYNYAHEVQ